jgi:ferredoxin
VSLRLRVNMIKCTGHGLCAELMPEFIGLDPWGYPIVPRADVPEDLAGLAPRAVSDCPALALLLERGDRD